MRGSINRFAVSVSRFGFAVGTAGRNLWLLGIWVEQNVLKKIPFYHRYKEFTDELTNAHVPELCLER